MTGPSVRCFVCLVPSEEVQESLEAFLAPWRRQHRDLKWVRREQLHLTLKFCGEQPQETVDALGETLEGTVRALSSFSLAAVGTGCFPRTGTQRVLWCGLDGDRDALLRLVERVEEGAVAAGLERERRPFSPHLTLARLRPGQTLPRGFLDDFRHPEPFGTPWTAGEILLMRSDLGPQGPRYSLLGQIPLDGGDQHAPRGG
ncbi:2'-5' RNA ligase [Aminomonas paucivorans DSM 12260]|uniref:RNA 2',3'-cyclic phosphodiesterase n=1 Tax=Aminomonas paucivorans DSM 12260 TaxID=584708 RepID=E3D0V8_9BACT|nr:RNA 2',3'-cyclic phosphodiesterase [Aminomonas paucivorans]EFQ23040.1 2'-5' RNA ligase [Aminomonas paucivorans DSM 12260]